MSLHSQFLAAKRASRILALLSTAEKNSALRKIVIALRKNVKRIEIANRLDLYAGEKKKLNGKFNKLTTGKLDRLRFDRTRIITTAMEITKVITLPDPVGKILEICRPRVKFNLKRISVPFGVIGIIYESRPNVTIDAIALALKSGNSIVLRGGTDALHTNRTLIAIIHATLKTTKIPISTVQFIDSIDRRAVNELITARGLVDVVIPRGGKNLIDFVVKNATVPTIETGASVVHLFVDKKADLKKAVALVVNSKTRRTSICNTLDTLLVHEKIARKFLLVILPELIKRGVKIHGDKKILTKISNIEYQILNTDFNREWLSLDLNVKIVANLDEAIRHIQAHSLGHTEVIVTEDRKAAEKFQRSIDAACVYVNLSTQFSDGGEFGLGAEFGISTQKLHTRGPFALSALTTYKWIGRGSGQIRK